MDKHEGGCFCGAVRVTADGEPKRVGICHCMACRKHHGAVFYAAAVFDHKDVEITGVPKSYQGRFFCGVCGSSVFARTDDEIEVHLGAFDDPKVFIPEYELWTERRENWLPEFPGTKTHKRNRD